MTQHRRCRGARESQALGSDEGGRHGNIAVDGLTSEDHRLMVTDFPYFKPFTVGYMPYFMGLICTQFMTQTSLILLMLRLWPHYRNRTDRRAAPAIRSGAGLIVPPNLYASGTLRFAMALAVQKIASDGILFSFAHYRTQSIQIEGTP